MIKDVYAATDIDLTNAGAASGINKVTDLSKVMGNAITIIVTIALVVFLFMVIFGAFEWIISGGDKEKVANARNRITHALIGLLLLGLAFLIVTVVSNIIGIPVLSKLPLPGLGD